ncbi:MAG TPA: aminoacyl-tRNA hydrolase [Bacillota bacterium]|nr:aminoacyl-tRNA hydrolase [Bacillota bacterium]
MIFSKPVYDAAVIGLGNPGDKYTGTRHNAGFCAVDYISGRLSCDMRRLKHMALCGKAELDGKKILLAKPQTFMNSSGDSVSDIARYYHLPSKKIIVICDDVTLLAGSLRIRKKGSAGGHNGLKSIIESLGSDEFVRIRLGVGSKYGTGELINFVLDDLSSEDDRALKGEFADVFEAIRLILDDNYEGAMSAYNKTVHNDTALKE